MKRILLAITALAFVGACSKTAAQIEPSYVSKNTFSGMSCSALNNERAEIIHQVNEFTGKQNDAANTDAVLMGVGLILFWPALLAMPMGADHAEQLAAAKGSYDAITTKMVESGCQLTAVPA